MQCLSKEEAEIICQYRQIRPNDKKRIMILIKEAAEFARRISKKMTR